MKRTLLLAMLVVVGALFAADYPMLGTWKLNVAKSKFSPGPGPQRSTATYTEDGGWIKVKAEGVDPEGKPFHTENRVRNDGKEYPVEFPSGKGTITLEQTDHNHWTSIVKMDSGRTITTHGVISKDAKVCTQTVTSINAKGEKVNNVGVWERQ